jgi:hypothetical protein
MNVNGTPPPSIKDGVTCPEVGVRWIVSQEGSRQTYGVPLAFEKVGCLRVFYADV